MAVRLSSPAGRYGVEQNAEINVTPFVDVMLVLLIIFMVVAAAATSAVKVDLPATPVLSNLPREPITVSIAADGNVYLNDRPSPVPGLAATITGLLADGAHEDKVVVRADKKVDYGRFIQVVSTLNRGGVTKLALMTEVAG